MSTLTTFCRLALGAILVLFAVSYYFPFIPIPPHPEPAREFTAALAATGYMYPLLKGTEFLCGLALLTGVLVPLALAMLAPVLVNILLFHIFLAPTGLGFVVLMALFELILVWTYREAFAGVLRL